MQHLPAAGVQEGEIDWAVRRDEFRALVETYRGKYAYDCIVPFSGGKDSTFTLYPSDDG